MAYNFTNMLGRGQKETLITVANNLYQIAREAVSLASQQTRRADVAEQRAERLSRTVVVGAIFSGAMFGLIGYDVGVARGILPDLTIAAKTALSVPIGVIAGLIGGGIKWR